MKGHMGLSNEKREEISSGDFVVTLSYLKKNQSTAYFVIHVYSNSFDFSPYLQKTNIQPNNRRNFLERLGFEFCDTCNILTEGKCYFQIIEEVDREGHFKDSMDHMTRIEAIYDRFRKFANQLNDIFNTMHEVDRKLYDSGIELPWENLI